MVIAGGRLSPSRRVSETSIEEIGLWMSGLWPGADGQATVERADAAS